MALISISPKSHVPRPRAAATLSSTANMVRKRSARDPQSARILPRAGLLAGLAVLLGFLVPPGAFRLVLFAFVVYSPAAPLASILRPDAGRRRCEGRIEALEARR
jgi:hypothetical protein